MITSIESLPGTALGFSLTDIVSKTDFEKVVLPKVEEYLKSHDTINMVLVMDTPISNMTIGAWYEDMLLGLKKLTKWRKLAIVSDEVFAEVSSKIMDTMLRGQYKCFDHAHKNIAFDWVGS